MLTSAVFVCLDLFSLAEQKIAKITSILCVVFLNINLLIVNLLVQHINLSSECQSCDHRRYDIAHFNYK